MKIGMHELYQPSGFHDGPEIGAAVRYALGLPEISGWTIDQIETNQPICMPNILGVMA
jgi:hypothetical protein